MVNKYNMTKEDNIFFTKRKLVDNAHLINYYETNDMTNIKTWIYDNCLDGIESK